MRIFTVLSTLSLMVLAALLTQRVGQLPWKYDNDVVVQHNVAYRTYVYSYDLTIGEQPHALTLQYRYAVVLAAIAPLTWLVLRLRRRGSVAGTCRACGYDLRATRESCPECGTVPVDR